MKENIKIGLIGIIALTLIVNTFFMDNKSSKVREKKPTPQSNVVANPTPTSNLNPTTNPLEVNPLQQPKVATPPAPSLSEGRTKTNIKFAAMNHDFGTIQQDSKNTKIFNFTNSGTEPLIIESAKGSCGCTVPKFPKEPILPGKTSEIEVVYSPGKQKGSQTKSITIIANTNPTSTVLNISANVETVGK